MNNKDNIDQNLSREDDDLKAIAPTLFSIKKENPFDIPKDYFDTLPAIIQERCSENVKVNFFDRFFWYFNRKLAAICFVIIAVITGLYVYEGKEKKDLKVSMAATEEYILEMEEAILLETFIKGDIASESDNTEDRETIDYLIENDINLQTIVNEL